MNPVCQPARLLISCLAAVLLAACGGLRVWPFADEQGRAPVPANATHYVCDANRGFYLRFLAAGEAWVILPEREFRLDRVLAAPGRRYSNGAATLDLGTDAAAEASLNDGPAIAYSGCKPALAR